MHFPQRTWLQVHGIVVASETPGFVLEVEENHALAEPRISKGKKICMLAPD